MVRMTAFGLRIGLGHIRSCLGRTVVFAPVAVIDVARRIQPYQTRTTARRDSLSRLRRRGGLRRRCRRSRRSSSHRSRGRSRSLRSRRCRRWRCRSRGRRSRRSIPLLHTLVSTASPLFAGSRRIGSILTLTSGSRRGSCRCLSHCNIRRQKPRRNRHQTNR
jgi:hypothetical protein